MSDDNEYGIERPGVVTFVGVIVYIQSAISAVIAISMISWRNDVLDYLEREGSSVTGGVFNATIVAQAIIAVLLFVAANGVMRGRDGFRLFVAIVQGISMGAAAAGLIAHHDGGYVYHAEFSLLLGVIVLWSLYGNQEANRYFADIRLQRSNRP